MNANAVYGKTAYLTPSVNTAVILLPNQPGSNQVYKINSITAANSDGINAINTTISIYSNGVIAQNSAPQGGTAFPLVSTVSVPANASLIVVDKSNAFYLEENTSIAVTSGAANKITYIVSYESIT